MSSKIALVGNPNCGKTTLFNKLTGSNQKIGNWPGVTVEKKEGRLKADKDIVLTDLPGIYSLSPYTLEEVIARNYLVKDKPDVVLNIVDGTQLERNLYLTTQVLELGIPVIVAVNMIDAVNKNGDKINIDALAKELGCTVLAISALKGDGISELENAISEVATTKSKAAAPQHFADDIEAAVNKIQEGLPQSIDAEFARYFAVKVFERDEKISDLIDPSIDIKSIQSKFENTIADLEKAHDDDSESIIANGRYEYIATIIDDCYTKNPKREMSTSDKIDRVVTNRWAALPIFVVVMFLVYYISVTTVGTYVTDWANDGVFGDGWFLGPTSGDYEEAAGEFEEAELTIDAYVSAAEEEGLDPDSATFAEDAATIDLIGTYEAYDDETGENEVVEVTYGDYEEALTVAEPDPNDYGIWVPGIPVLFEDALTAINAADWLLDLIVNGIVAGVGAVLGFVPQMLVLFLLLAILEYCGYMARVAFILDRIFSKFGLSGKSFIPILIGTGCGVPGVMASRTIENQNDRRMTIMTTTFIPCGAKLPIIALFASAIFGGAWWVAPSAYFLGIVVILCSGIMLKKTRFFVGEATPFIMELPAYHMPTVGSVARSVWERAWSFIKKAGTLILLATIVVWFISGYGWENGVFTAVEDQNNSLLAVVGSGIAWLFIPLGWGEWEPAAATITGLIAKENFVATVGVLYEGGSGWYTNLQMAFAPAAAYSMLAFNLLCAPCFAAMGTIKREMNNPKWFWAAVGYECGTAYVVAMWIYQFAGLAGGEVGFNIWTIVAIILLVAFLYLLFRPDPSKKQSKIAGAASAQA